MSGVSTGEQEHILIAYLKNPEACDIWRVTEPFCLICSLLQLKKPKKTLNNRHHNIQAEIFLIY